MNTLEKILLLVVIFLAIWFIGSYVEVMTKTLGEVYNSTNLLTSVFGG